MLSTEFWILFIFSIGVIGWQYYQNRLEHLRIFRSEKQLKDILDSLPGAVSLIQNDRYVVVNQVVETLSGLPAHQIEGQIVGALNPESPLPIALRSFIESNESALSVEMSLETTAGSRTHLIILKKMQTDPSLTVVASFDVHDLRLAEKEILAQRAQLEESAKMASLGEMSSGLAHEINNPLSVIIAKAQLLIKRQDYSAEERNKTLETIIKTSRRISAIVRGLKTFARDADQDPFEPADLKTILEDTLTFCEQRIRNHGIKLTCILPDSSTTTLECRGTQISQVLLNLLNNSHDAIESLPEKWITVEMLERPDYLEIQITDSGNGIPESVREKLMTPFFTTKEVGKGTGLGLSLSRGIILSHQGEFYFNHNHPNTQAIIRLPRRQTPQSSSFGSAA